MLDKINRSKNGTALDKVRGKHILVDGDIYAYRCAASAEKTLYLVVDEFDLFERCDSYKEAMEVVKNSKHPAEIWSRKEVQPLEFALQACKTALDALLAKLNPSKVSVFLSPDRTFRHDLARTKTYKGNRNQLKPKYLQDVKDYLVKQYGATYGSNVEADDEIGAALSVAPGLHVSVSIDKDLLQVPGWHYNWINDTVRHVTPRQGDFAFYTQMLTGDATDNIPGIAGIGPAKAATALTGARSSKELCSRVWNIYRSQFNTTEDAVRYFNEQAALLWILRKDSYSEQTGGYVCPIELM